MIQRPQSDYSTLGPGKLFRPYSQNRTFGAFLLLIGLLRNIKISIYPYECKHSMQKIFVSQCTLKTAYTIYIENVKTLEIGKDIRGIMCESM